MNKSIRNLCCCGLALLMSSSGQSVEAGIIPWTYNAIFGPVGSTFAPRRAMYGPVGRAAFYQGSVCCPTSPCAPCGPCGHSAGYAPYTVGYSSYYAAPATSFGCSTCGPTSCPGGNCGYYTPATGSTMAPVQSSGTSSATPTQTFKSTEPTVNPEALERRQRSYDDDDGFETPTRPNSNSGEGRNSSSSEQKEEKKEDSAPLFDGGFSPFGSSSTESLKVPLGPPVPVEKREPAPASEPETNKGGLTLPPIRFEPDPVAVSGKPTEFERTRTASRSVRASNYSIPEVARNSSGNTDAFVPPLPAPVQMVKK